MAGLCQFILTDEHALAALNDLKFEAGSTLKVVLPAAPMPVLTFFSDAFFSSRGIA